jgi:hypothetical protein
MASLNKLAGSGNMVYGDIGDIDTGYHGQELAGHIKKLSTPEKDAINDFLRKYQGWMSDDIHDELMNKYPGMPEHKKEEFDPSALPVHQQLSYGKRPKKLGAELKDKKDILGDNSDDKQKEVQYMKLHKKLKFILESIRKSYVKS